MRVYHSSSKVGLVTFYPQFLHASGFIHRDLKLKNIIYDPKTERVKIIDMGLCLPRTEHENWKERQRRKTYVNPSAL